MSSVILDSQGNLYGTTSAGGIRTSCNGAGCGIVFKLGKNGKETVLHRFTGGADGAFPVAGLIRDASGHLYGTTIVGGGSGTCITGYKGCGTVFMLDASGNETILHGFTGGDHDGALPYAPLIEDDAGNLYGTTFSGGSNYECGTSQHNGCGTVFKLDPTSRETLMHKFVGGDDGANPSGALVRTASGAFYGTTSNGGLSNLGTIFKLDHTGKERVLYALSNESLGEYPYPALMQDAGGNLYGTTTEGGDMSCGYSQGCGVVFELTP